MPRWLECAVPHCSEKAPSGDRPFCIAHERRIPSDLVERLRFASEDSADLMDYQAALAAIIEEIA